MEPEFELSEDKKSILVRWVRSWYDERIKTDCQCCGQSIKPDTDNDGIHHCACKPYNKGIKCWLHSIRLAEWLYAMRVWKKKDLPKFYREEPLLMKQANKLKEKFDGNK